MYVCTNTHMHIKLTCVHAFMSTCVRMCAHTHTHYTTNISTYAGCRDSQVHKRANR